MPKITFLPEGITVNYNPATMPFSDHGKPGSILDIALNHGIHLEHACGGSCACTTCHIVVKKGENSLSEMQDDEADRLDMAADLTLHSRLGCQCVVQGTADIVLEIPAWNRNYISEGGASILGDAIPAKR